MGFGQSTTRLPEQGVGESPTRLPDSSADSEENEGGGLNPPVITAGACALRKDEYEDRRSQPGGFIKQGTFPHAAQRSILPLKINCKHGTSIGTCFLIDELNDVTWPPAVVHFATAAHNLFCGKCNAYRSVKPILQWAEPGQEKAKVDDSRQDVREVYYGWKKVSQKYIDLVKAKKGANECFSDDYGVLAVKCDEIVEQWFRNVANNLFVAPERDRKCVELAHVCGYPLEVWTGSRKEEPQSNVEVTYPPTENAYPNEGTYKWDVGGGMYWMPIDASIKGKETDSPDSQRRSAALFDLPQDHCNMDRRDTLQRECSGRLYRHYIDTSGGQSGAPVYLHNKDNNQFVALGIHVGVWVRDSGYDTKCKGFNVAVRLYGNVLTEMKQWTQNSPPFATL